MANARFKQGGKETRQGRTVDGRGGSVSGGHDRDSVRRRFADWLAEPSGERLLASERPLVQETVRRFHGESLLWLGPSPDLLDTTHQCMVRVRIYGALGCTRSRALAADAGAINDHAVDVVGVDPVELPFGSGSIDGIVLHHTLDVLAHRRSTLREVARILSAGGRLVVVGFNPMSLWLLAKPLPAFRDLRPLSVPRLAEWLGVLGLARETRTAYLNYRSGLPVALDRARWQTAGAWLDRVQSPLGGVYVHVVRKQGHGFILQARRERRENRELAAALPNATRQRAT